MSTHLSIAIAQRLRMDAVQQSTSAVNQICEEKYFENGEKYFENAEKYFENGENYFENGQKYFENVTEIFSE